MTMTKMTINDDDKNNSCGNDMGGNDCGKKWWSLNERWLMWKWQGNAWYMNDCLYAAIKQKGN